MSRIEVFYFIGSLLFYIGRLYFYAKEPATEALSNNPLYIFSAVVLALFVLAFRVEKTYRPYFFCFLFLGLGIVFCIQFLGER